MSLSCLWNCIHVTLCGRKSDLNFVKTYLSRSGQLPLSIEFNCRLGEDTNSDSSGMESDSEGSSRCPCDKVWDVLFEEHARWRHCVINTRGTAHIAAITQRMNRQFFPVLEHLQMSWALRTEHSHARTLDLTAPKLTQLRFTEPRYDNARALRSITPQLFAQLTTLELVHFKYTEPAHLDHFADLLRSASETLEVLILRRAYFYLDIPDSTLAHMPTTLPRLACLVIERVLEDNSADYSIVATLCRNAPALEQLLIVGQEPSHVHTYIHDGALVFPRVRSLRYYVPQSILGSRLCWPRFAAAFPRLQALHISGGNPAPLLAAVARLGAPAWPDLRELVILGPHEYSAVRFVQQRACDGRPLERVSYAGWFGVRAQQMFKDLGVTFTPSRETIADGDDFTMDWVKYLLEVDGTLPRESV